MSTHDKSVDGGASGTSVMSKMSLFTPFPEALHRPDGAQCKQVNGELMKKIVMEKMKNNLKFKDGKCMNELFRYYPNRHELSGSNNPQ